MLITMSLGMHVTWMMTMMDGVSWVWKSVISSNCYSLVEASNTVNLL